MKNVHANKYFETLDQYREVFEEIDDIVLIMNEQGVIEYVNRALRKILGFKNKKYTGRNVADCLLFEKQMSKQDFIKKLYKKREFVTFVKNAKGDVLHLSWKTKIFSQNKEKKLMAVIRDITTSVELEKKSQQHSKNLQEMVYKRTQQLEKEKQKAVELHEAKGIFLSKMSHELRTPLTAICGYAELLDDPQLNKQDIKKYINVISRNGRSLLQMINETLDMVKLEQDKYQISEKVFDLEKFVNDLEDTLSILAQEKNIKLRFSIAQGVPQKLYTDPQALRQILTNLISNAIKFTDVKGNILVKIKQRTFPHKVSQKLYFYVEDTGVGIPKEYHRRIFRSFEQYLDHHMVSSRGTGLGLAISKQLARLLGGNLRLLSSTPGVGSTFVVSIPVLPLKRKKSST